MLSRILRGGRLEPGSREPVFRHGRGLDPDERRALAAELAVNRAWLTPPDSAAAIGALVLPVLATMKVAAAGEAAPFRAAGYAAGLAGIPANAIAEACRLVLSGEAGLSATFAPTPAELAEFARSIAAGPRATVTAIDGLLAAPEQRSPPSAEERTRTLARIEAFVGRARGRGTPEARQGSKEGSAQEDVDAILADHHPTPDGRAAAARRRADHIAADLANRNFPLAPSKAGGIAP